STTPTARRSPPRARAVRRRWTPSGTCATRRRSRRPRACPRAIWPRRSGPRRGPGRSLPTLRGCAPLRRRGPLLLGGLLGRGGGLELRHGRRVGRERRFGRLRGLLALADRTHVDGIHHVPWVVGVLMAGEMPDLVDDHGAQLRPVPVDLRVQVDL